MTEAARRLALHKVDECVRIGDLEPLVSALKKLSKDNLSNLTPHPFYVFLNYTHPPVVKRIEALEAE